MADLADDIVSEHRRIADTLEELGPDAPGGVGTWTTGDIAAHLLSQVAAGGAIVFVGRSLVARGVRLNARAGAANDRAIAWYRRRGFEPALGSLRGGPPRLLLRPNVAPVTLQEVWLHHDDVRRANGLPPPAEPEGLRSAVATAHRYQRSRLTSPALPTGVSDADLLRWLTGRPSSIPAHDPPLTL